MNFSRSRTRATAGIASPVSNRFFTALLATFAALIISVLGTTQWASADGGTTVPDPDPPPTPTLNAPRHVTAIAGDESAAVAWVKPAESDAAVGEILGYVVNAHPSDIFAETRANDTLVIVEGLENGIEYTFTVVAFNEDGRGAVSEPSNPITPEEGIELNEEKLERLRNHIHKLIRHAKERLHKAQERAREQLEKNRHRIDNWLSKQTDRANGHLTKTIEKANEQDHHKTVQARNWLDRLKDQLQKKLDRAEGTDRYDAVAARVAEATDKAEHKLVDRLENSREKTDARIAKAEETTERRIHKAEQHAENSLAKTEERLSEKISKFSDRLHELLRRLRQLWLDGTPPCGDGATE
jgi:hypothetical protein